MPLVHPSAGVNYHGSMQLSRFTSSEGTVLGKLEQLLFKSVAVGVPHLEHIPPCNPPLAAEILGKEDKYHLHPCFLWRFVSCSLCCFAGLTWNSGARVTFGGPAHPTAPMLQGGRAPWAAPVPAAPHPWASPTARVIQCASALTFTGTLWLFCVEHIILMGGNQINSKPHLTSASCEDSGNSVCCIPSSPSRGNLLASNACCVQWEPRNRYHFILLCCFTTVWILTKWRTQLKHRLTPHTTPAHVHIDGNRTYLHLQAANCEVLKHNRDCAGI